MLVVIIISLLFWKTPKKIVKAHQEKRKRRMEDSENSLLCVDNVGTSCHGENGPWNLVGTHTRTTIGG